MALFAHVTILSGGASASEWSDNCADGFAGGDGYPGTPYLIATPEQLALMASRVNRSDETYRSRRYKLTADIDLGAHNWTPIALSNSYEFRGSFDGDGHTISNMKVTGSFPYAGLFGFIGGPGVKNLALRDVDVQSSAQEARAGGLAGLNSGNIENVTVTGSVKTTGASASVGGLVGWNDSNITSCASSCAVISAGGLGEFGTGGLVGFQWSGTIATSLATGAVTATDLSLSVIVGGFAGYSSEYYSEINNSLATGFVTGTGTSSNVGGFFGRQNAASCTDSAFDKDSTGQTTAESGGALVGVTPMTTADLTDGAQGTSTFGAASWRWLPGYYPMPTALLGKTGTANAVAYIAMVKPITFSGTDTASNVTTPFTIPKKDAAGNDIKWVFSSTNAVSLDLGANTYTVAWTAETTNFVLTAEMPGGTRSFKLVLTGKTANKVTFDSKGGSTVADAYPLKDEKVTKPTDPTWLQNTFDGWYEDTDFTDEWDFDNDTVDSDITLYAKWTLKTCTVTFKSDGEDYATKTPMVGDFVEKPANPTKSGYVLDGWYKEETFENKWDFANDTVDGDMTLYAKWAVQPTAPETTTHTVTFDSVGGTSVAPISVADGGTINAPAAPTKTGYAFGGWYKDAACTSAWDFAADTVTSATTLYAKWTPADYTVTFEASGGTSVASVGAAYGSTITPPAAPTKAGHAFGGWYKEAACTNAWNFATDTVTGDVTLYAKWSPAVCTVTFESNGGSAVAAVSTTHGSAITAPTPPPAKAGYIFSGWHSDSELTKPWDFDTDTVTQDITLYAKWTEDGGKLISADEALDIVDADSELTGIVSVVPPASEDVLAASDEIIEIGGLTGTTITEINIVESVPESAFEPRPTSKISGALGDDTRALTPSVYVKIPTENGNVMPMSFTVQESAISSDLPDGWAAMPDADKADYLAEDAEGTATVFAYEYIKSDGTVTAPVPLIGRGGPYTWAYAIEQGVVTFSASGDMTLNYLAVAADGEPFIADKFLVIPDKQPYPGYITDPVWLMRESKGTEAPTGGSSGCATGAGAVALLGLGITLIRRRR